MAMVGAALRVWHRTIRTAPEDRVPRLARRLLKILHAPTYKDGVPTKGYLTRLKDNYVQPGPGPPIEVAVDCLGRYDSGVLTKEEVISEIEDAVRRWWANGAS